VQQAKSRAILQRHNRQTTFKDPDYANKKMNNLLRGHPEQFRRTRLTMMQFELLAEWLYQNTELDRSRHASSKTKLAIFLYICGHGVSYRSASIHWEASISQTGQFFHQVLSALLLLAKKNIVMYKADEDVPVPPQIRQNVGKMFLFFKDCVGEIDGTLVYASVKGEDRKRDGEEGAYRCRKGFLALNVLDVWILT
jgi:hypothetical protein